MTGPVVRILKGKPSALPDPTARHTRAPEELYASPLAETPYDLRHAAISTQLNAGISPTQVAEWAGQ